MTLSPVLALALPERCYRCGALTRALVGVLAGRAERLLFLDFERIAPSVAAAISPSELRGLRIGPVKPRASRLRGIHLANGCVQCDAILGSFFVREALDEFLAEGGTIGELVVARWLIEVWSADPE
jgi:hypothetical protein